MRKGFTLIELLAVILVLGVVSLIAVPVVGNIVNEAKRGATERSAGSYITAAEQEITISEMRGTSMSGRYEVNDLDLDLKGQLPVDGYINVQNGEINEYKLIYDDYIVSKENNDFKPVVYSSSGASLIDDVDSNTTLSMGDKFCIGTECFYVISNNNGTVRALAEWNLNVGYNATYNGSNLLYNRDISNLSLSYDSTNKIVKYTELEYVKLNPTVIKQDSTSRVLFETDSVDMLNNMISYNISSSGNANGYWAPSGSLLSTYGTDYPAYVYDNNSSLSTYINAYAESLSNKLGATITADLLRYDEFFTIGCSDQTGYCGKLRCTKIYVEMCEGIAGCPCTTVGEEIDMGATAPRWVYQTNYWTGVAATAKGIFVMGTDSGELGYTTYNRIIPAGLRPVINIPANLIS